MYLNNLRPILLVPLPGKLFEKILHSRLSGYFESNNLLCIEQGGFRKSLDTSQTVYDLVNYINTGFDLNNSQCLAAFADLAKAFDSLDRTLLLKKLNMYGIRGNFLKLLTSYLSNRKQQVNLNGILSELKPINYVVPQGSILGPLLFIIFVNDLPQHNFNSQISIYADDTVLYFKHNDFAHMVKQMKNDLYKYHQWCLLNKLSLNTTKTKLMLFSDRKKNIVNHPTLFINDIALDFVENYTYLGIKLDRQLNFKQHFSTLMSNLQYKILLLCKIRPLIRSLSHIVYHILNMALYFW